MDFENQPMTEQQFFKMERKKKTKNHKLYFAGCILLFGVYLVRAFIWWFSYLGFDLPKNVRLTFYLCFGVAIIIGGVLNLIGLIKIKKAYKKYLENYSPENQEE